MAEGPDPLGKQALYWMPVSAQVPVANEEDPAGAGLQQDEGPGLPTGGRRARSSGKHALYSEASSARTRQSVLVTDTGTDPLSLRGSLVVECSACAAVTRVGVLDFVVLQFPFGAWVPRRAFDHWMTCPACRRRAWTSVTLFSAR
ncbi:MAG: hypothetical protein ACYCV7_03450 [Acidimicrobiales bacterium]